MRPDLDASGCGNGCSFLYESNSWVCPSARCSGWTGTFSSPMSSAEACVKCEQVVLNGLYHSFEKQACLESCRWVFNLPPSTPPPGPPTPPPGPCSSFAFSLAPDSRDCDAKAGTAGIIITGETLAYFVATGGGVCLFCCVIVLCARRQHYNNRKRAAAAFAAHMARTTATPGTVQAVTPVADPGVPIGIPV